ncbi:ribonuclease III [Candidatus Sumerlaeota bacterium]|nr:ribonuclease III [Candidatus Sumerlaeota bacterium]
MTDEYTLNGEEHEAQLVAFLDEHLPDVRPGELIRLALVHRSYAFENQLNADNERLEFLGDALIGFEVSSYLFEKHPAASEGELSRMKATIVSRSMLGRLALSLGMDALVLLGKGEEKSGGRHRRALIGSVFEAFVGAVFLEVGLEAATRFIREHLIHQVSTHLVGEDFTDYKSRLQELAQKRWQQIPQYRIVEETGPDHSKQFCVEVSLAGKKYGRGMGRRKKTAENDAAREALAALTEMETARK